MGGAPTDAPRTVTVASVTLLIMAATAAIADWLAVGLRVRLLEYLCKPLTVALLVATALALHPADGLRRGYFVAALVLSLAGDILLMLPGARAEEPEAGAEPRRGARAAPAPLPTPRARTPVDLFLAGLGCFLVAHLDYIAGLRASGPGIERVALALLVVAPVALPLGTLIARSLGATDRAALRPPVVVYMAVITAMVASAVATGSLLAMAGAWLFLGSDALIAVNRFVRRWAPAPVLIAVSYHVAQGLLTASLVRS